MFSLIWLIKGIIFHCARCDSADDFCDTRMNVDTVAVNKVLSWLENLWCRYCPSKWAAASVVALYAYYKYVLSSVLSTICMLYFKSLTRDC